MSWGMFALAFVLGLDLLAGGTSLGLQGLPRTQWARVAVLFAAVAFLMLVAGVLIGRALGDQLGTHATYFAGVLLLLVGVRALLEARQGHEPEEETSVTLFSWMGLLGIALVICMDKFAAGLSLATSDQSLTGFMAYLIAQTFVISVLGFWLGTRVGARMGAAAELVAGGIFVVLGLFIIFQTWQGGKLPV